MSAGEQQVKFPSKRFLTFNGPIAAPSTQSLRIALCEMINQQAEEITILFSSNGGSIEDGMALYTYLKALPVKLTMHATGFVKSIAVPVFLAGTQRLAASNAKFLFHGYTWTTGVAETALMEVLEERTKTLEVAVAWSKEIVKATTKLTDNDFKSLNLFDQPRIFIAAECADRGIVSSVVEPQMKAEFWPRVVV